MSEAVALVMIPKLDEHKSGCVLDVHPLVLCKDCKHCDGVKDLPIIGESAYCIKMSPHIHAPDWFCADGEQRDK